MWVKFKEFSIFQTLKRCSCSAILETDTSRLPPIWKPIASICSFIASIKSPVVTSINWMVLSVVHYFDEHEQGRKLPVINEFETQSKRFYIRVRNWIRLDRFFGYSYSARWNIWELLCRFPWDERVPAVPRRLLYSATHCAKAKITSLIWSHFGKHQRSWNLIFRLLSSPGKIFQFQSLQSRGRIKSS